MLRLCQMGINCLARLRDGQSLVEYTLLVGLISFGVFGLFALMGVGGQVFAEVTARLRMVPGVSQQ